MKRSKQKAKLSEAKLRKYKVIIKEVYTYEDVPAKSKQEAIDKVIAMDWPAHDEQDKPLEIKAIRL